MKINKYKWAFILFVSVLFVIPGFYISKDRESIELTDEIRKQAPGQFADLPHGKVHYRLEGSDQGPLVVLVHGFVIPDFLWDHTATMLVENGYQVLRFDLYGHGFSDRPDVDYTRQLFVEQLSGLVDKVVPGKKFDLMGISMGAPIVSEYASLNHDRVNHLVLEDPLGLAVDIGPLSTPLIGEYLSVIGMVDRLEEGLRVNFHDTAKMPDWKERYQYQMQIEGFSRAMLSILRNFLSQDQWEVYERLGQNDLPVLLLWGKEDVLAPFSQSDIIMQLVPNAKLVAVEGVGHLVHQEGSHAVDPELLKFLTPVTNP